ncbi:YbfB/YjiJ family MFS transporter [Glutamicibacter sp. JL.03c]|uniref:YbfB/YjiJ family MFS transporter n=1 Tax=Glutamicibacter sp. JL.03c TaxID=2984842 RepID=UPI0021F7369E|nr:YbfB/YjiJ family MFS transporter [Glutamicibacter sp. JL.03c]UYQ77279.1 YbfB/YjiJ family MFS transporter [Glutamicibacter sp. JL.03c]
MNSASTESAEEVADPAEKGRGWALARYVAASTLVRSADGGAVVAIVLLAQASGLPGWVSGLLGASITAPHLLGPFIARRLDTARDGRKVIALAALVHGVLLGAAGLLLPVTWAAVPAVLLIVSGLFGPMLTGGVSSRLPSIAGPSQRSQRRAQGWDVASYGLSGTLGPAAVAWIAAGPGPLTATLALAAAAIAGAGGVLILPRQDPQVAAADVPSPGRTLLVIWRSGPLRRTLSLTVVVAFAVAVLPIYAVAVAPSLGSAALAGTLVAGYGVGSLTGSAVLMAWPLRGESDRLTAVLALVVAASLAVVLMVPGFVSVLVSFGIAGIANSLFFAATLAARSEHAPAEARGQVFIWVGALKIAAGSAGTAVAGALITGIVWLPVALVAGLTALAGLVSTAERVRSR